MRVYLSMSGLGWSEIELVERRGEGGEGMEGGRGEASGGKWSERERRKVDCNGVKWN